MLARMDYAGQTWTEDRATDSWTILVNDIVIFIGRNVIGDRKVEALNMWNADSLAYGYMNEVGLKAFIDGLPVVVED